MNRKCFILFVSYLFVNYESFFVALFRTFGEVWMDPLTSLLSHLHTMNSSDSPTVQHLLTSGWPAPTARLFSKGADYDGRK